MLRFFQNISITLIAIILTLLASEAIVRIFFPQPRMSGTWLVYTKHGYWANKSSGNAWHIIGEHNHKKVVYHFFSPHLRDTKINPNIKNKILVLGDSYTFGLFLPWKNTYIYQLQKKVNQSSKKQYQFLNAATNGWGTADYLAYLEDYGKIISPKFVLVFINTDDIGRAMLRNLYQLKKNSELVLIKKFHPLPFEMVKNLMASSVGTWCLEHSELAALLHRAAVTLISHNPILSKQYSMRKEQVRTQENIIIRIPRSSAGNIKNKQYAERFGEALFLRMKTWCDQNHAKLLVVTTGFNAFYPKNFNDPTYLFLKNAAPFFARNDIPFYDIAPAFLIATRGKQIELSEDMHPNALGAKIIADLTWPWIKNQLTVKSLS